MPGNKISFDRIIVLLNPASTNTARAHARIVELGKIFGPKKIKVLETSPEGREANQKLLLGHKKLLGPDTLLCIGAGDGTVNLTIEFLLTCNELSKMARLTPILPLWGGNANDMAHMLNGYPLGNKLNRVINQGAIVSVRPLRITLNGENVKIATSYASFGAIAFAANRINKPSHRKRPFTGIFGLRLGAELYTISKAFIAVPVFRIMESGKEKSIYEYAMINGTRMAKVERMPVRLTDKAFYVAKISRKHPVALLYVLRILRQKRFGRITSQPRSFTVLDDTWLQTDGEVSKIKAGTKVTIDLNPEPFYALSRRLPH